MGFSLFLLCLSLGMRHGVDADHLAVIDSLSRVRPRPWNGVLFALGHGLTVTILAVGAGALALPFPQQSSAWLLIGLGGVNLWRLLRPAQVAAPLRLPAISPLLLGMLFAAGFETASQLTALMLVREVSPWLLGLAFSLGMVLVDGVDGFLASRVWRSGGSTGAQVLGWTVVAFSFGLGGAELMGWELDAVALPLGLGLFTLLVAVRLWGLRWNTQT